MMIIASDHKVLDSIRELLRRQAAGNDLAQVSDALIDSRDRLAFHDDDWYREFTDHVVTLDSASSFEPKNSHEREVVERAIQTAYVELRRLTEKKAGD